MKLRMFLRAAGAAAVLSALTLPAAFAAYNTLKDFTPISLVARIPLVLAVPPALGVNSVQEPGQRNRWSR